MGFPTFMIIKKEKREEKIQFMYTRLKDYAWLILGDLGQCLDEEMIEEIGDVDVLMIPVGGEFTIGPKRQ